ncbi:MAG TPA: TetR/AcrR family transcriptional regulator [Rhizomicrobium sp.]|jgi:AcrR family transcriptional regulator|nr:TetR/AcrR family transcriptional regulator [Rhizomicrobium sp.]
MTNSLLRESASEASTGRRRAIVRALHQCIREQGYARTSLTDIALKAGMSPSHIRYYFDGKEAILRDYFAQLCQDLVERIRAIPCDNPEAWLVSFARFHFGNARISQSGLAVIVEIFGVAMHEPEMKRIKTVFDAEMHAIMEQFFERAGCADGLTPKTAAELARAMDIGLKYSTAFSVLKADALETLMLAGIRRLMKP